MDEFAKKSPDEMAPYFEAAREKTGHTPLILEKDFWVCWTLKRLFSLQALSGQLTFKGGTSLSKAFGIIKRFSEDIDVTIDRTALGFDGDKNPEGKGRDKRDKLLRELKDATKTFVQGPLFKMLEDEIAQGLKDSQSWKLYIDPDDPDGQTLIFEYPTNRSEKGSGYLAKEVKIEFGSRGDRWPSKTKAIRSYVAEALPDEFESGSIDVEVLGAERTFWEKATILHQLYHWPTEKPIPQRYARHYYDVYCLLKSDLRDGLMKSSDLLEKVAEHKRQFFRSGAAKYDLARKGSLKLSLPDHIKEALERDYESMQEMIFGEAPIWKNITGEIANFEILFNTRDI